MYLHKKSKNIKQKILDSLNDESTFKSVMYWRKDWLIHEWFCDNFLIENCEEVEISKEALLELIKCLEEYDGEGVEDKEGYKIREESIKKLNEVIEETDWENEEIYYYAWW